MNQESWGPGLSCAFSLKAHAQIYSRARPFNSTCVITGACGRVGGGDRRTLYISLVLCMAKEVSSQMRAGSLVRLTYVFKGLDLYGAVV